MEFLKSPNQLVSLSKESLGTLARMQARACKEHIMIDGASSTKVEPAYVRVDEAVFEAAITKMIQEDGPENQLSNTEKLALVVSELSGRLVAKWEAETRMLAKFCVDNTVDTEGIEELREGLVVLDSTVSDIFDQFRDTYTGKGVRDMGGYLAGFEAPARTDTKEKVAPSTSSSSGATKAVSSRRIKNESVKSVDSLSSRGRTVMLSQSVARNSMLDKIPNLKIEERDSIEEWFTKVEVAAELSGINSMDLLKNILHKLTGNAFQLAFRMLNEGDRNVEWHEFKNRLFEMYRLSDEQYSLKKQLRELSLEKCEYDFEKFMVRFQTITSRMVGVSEQQLVFEFLESLPKSLRVDLIARNADTGLREAIKAASHLVECHVQKSDVVNVNAAKSTSRANRRVEWKNREPSDSDSEIEGREIVCYRCKKRGHIAKNCRVRRTNLAQDVVGDEDENDIEEEDQSYMVQKSSSAKFC